MPNCRDIMSEGILDDCEHWNGQMEAIFLFHPCFFHVVGSAHPDGDVDVEKRVYVGRCEFHKLICSTEMKKVYM